jgi:phosphatidylglycerophosphate synthase
MRKIPEDYDNIFDNYLIRLCDILSPYAFSLGLTPNAITTLSNIMCIISIIFILKGKYYLGALFLLISYYFDCMDGHMARKYDMVTVFGDYYDHISDITKIIAVLITLLYINSSKFLKVLPIIIILAVLMTVHLGCQELLYNTNESETLSLTKKFCLVNNSSNSIEVKSRLFFTRFFGCGTFYLGLLLIIIFY